MNRQYINQYLRSLPTAASKTPAQRKTFLKEHIEDALNFYAKDIAAISHKGVRDRSLKCLKYFYWMHKYYEGWLPKEIAFAMKVSISAATTGIKNTEAKIERYVKIKKRGER